MFTEIEIAALILKLTKYELLTRETTRVCKLNSSRCFERGHLEDGRLKGVERNEIQSIEISVVDVSESMALRFVCRLLGAVTR